MSHDYSDNVLIQDSAGNLLRDELGGQVLDWRKPMIFCSKANKQGNGDVMHGKL